MSADAIGHTLSGVRVQRVVVAASPQIIKRGRGWRRGLCKRVVSPQGKRLTMICASLALLQIMFAVHRFAQGAMSWKCTPSACGISPGGGDLLSPYLSADLSRSTHSEE